jgi:tripartite-type tricarboxylate transporter receptor subunit TctC
MPRLIGLIVWLLLAGGAAAQPERTVRIICGFAPGGSADISARLIADLVVPLMGARGVVENRTGVNGVIGAELVARSAPDGNTVFQCPMSTMAITPQLVGANLPIDPGVELMPVTTLALSSYGLMVAANGPYRSLADVVAAARARPGQLSYGSAGVGSAQHLSGVMLGQRTSTDLVHIPYRGATPALLDLMGGRIDFMITNLADGARQIQDGAVRLLGIGDPTPSPIFPDAPRLSAELPGWEVLGWYGICAPRGLPREVVVQWEQAMARAMTNSPLPARLTAAGLTPLYEDSAALTARLARDRAQWGGVIRSVAVRAE